MIQDKRCLEYTNQPSVNINKNVQYAVYLEQVYSEAANDYAILTKCKRNSNGANHVIVSQVMMKAGLVSTGNWTAFKSVDFGAILIDNATLGSNDVLTFKIKDRSWDYSA
jgi:hypothetical protein